MKNPQTQAERDRFRDHIERLDMEEESEVRMEPRRGLIALIRDLLGIGRR